MKINTPNDANDLNIGMVHQHFKLVECFSVLDNIILGVEPTRGLFLEKKKAREKVLELSNKYADSRSDSSGDRRTDEDHEEPGKRGQIHLIYYAQVK